jgi:peptidylprolyl isomerase
MMIKKFIPGFNLLFVIVITISLVSCNPARKYEKQEADEIATYLSMNPNLEFVKKTSGLYYYEVVAGTGRAAATHDTAYLKYTAKFLDGTVFDTNVGKTDSLVFPINEGWMITGFDEGVTYMNQGGKALFLVPSNLAYGTSGYYIIQGYTPLLFDVELVRIKPGPGK